MQRFSKLFVTLLLVLCITLCGCGVKKVPSELMGGYSFGMTRNPAEGVIKPKSILGHEISSSDFYVGEGGRLYYVKFYFINTSYNALCGSVKKFLGEPTKEYSEGIANYCAWFWGPYQLKIEYTNFEQGIEEKNSFNYIKQEYDSIAFSMTITDDTYR